MIRVSKPRVGGGFGAKQTAVSAVYPAFVTWMTKKPSKIIFSRRREPDRVLPRHEMQMHVRLGADQGRHRARHRPAYAVEHGRLRRARPDNGRSCPATSPFRSTAGPRRSASRATLCIRTSCLRARTAATARRRDCSRSRAAVNELAARLGMDPFELREKRTSSKGRRHAGLLWSGQHELHARQVSCARARDDRLGQ